jgi:hypothetical protein
VLSSTRDVLTKNGFVILGVYAVEDSGEERLRETGLGIRKKTLHFHDR